MSKIMRKVSSVFLLMALVLCMVPTATALDNTAELSMVDVNALTDSQLAEIRAIAEAKVSKLDSIQTLSTTGRWGMYFVYAYPLIFAEDGTPVLFEPEVYNLTGSFLPSITRKYNMAYYYVVYTRETYGCTNQSYTTSGNVLSTYYDGQNDYTDNTYLIRCFEMIGYDMTFRIDYTISTGLKTYDQLLIK